MRNFSFFVNTSTSPLKVREGVAVVYGKERVSHRYTIVLLFFLAVAFWLRIRHLGALSLMGDEGIQALAIQGIFQHGVPKLESGLVYLRAPLFLYMQAAFTHLFELDAFWLRLPSVVWGVATLIPAYLLGKTLFDRSVGVGAAAIMAFSVWEIELSRYARFYTAFQFFFLVGVICFYRGFMRDEMKYRVGFLIASFFALSTHQMGQLLGVLFLIPILSPAISRVRKGVCCLWGLGFGGGVLLYRNLTGLLHRWGDSLRPLILSEEASSAGTIEHIVSTLGLPPLKLPDFGHFVLTAEQYPFWLFVFALVAGLATFYLGYRLIAGDGPWQVMLAMMAVWAAFAHQFGVALIFGVLYVGAFARRVRILRAPVLRAGAAAGFMLAIGWTAVMAGPFNLSVRRTIDVLLGFPNVFGYFLRWFVSGWPVMTVFLVVGSILLFVRFIRNRRDTVAIFLLGALYLPMLAASMFDVYAESRYVFHLYPLVVIVFLVAIYPAWNFLIHRLGHTGTWGRRLAAAGGIMLVLLVSQDANPLYAWNVSNRTYESPKDPVRGAVSWHYYAGYHPDREQPSQYVKARLAKEDKVVVLGPAHMIALYHVYVGRVDYTLAPAINPSLRDMTPRSYARVRDGTPIHYVDGSELIFELAELKQLIQDDSGGGAVWILGDRPLLLEENGYYPLPMREYLQTLAAEPDIVGRDGKTFAVKVR